MFAEMMLQDPKVCVCGGGNIGHSLVAAFGRYADVGILTRRPEAWARKLQYQIGSDVVYETNGRVIATDNPSIVKNASVIIIALPRFAIEEELSSIEPFLHQGQAVVFVPAPAGLESVAERLGKYGVEVVGFQRVPFISRIKEYGKFVGMGSVRPISKLAIPGVSKKEVWKKYFETAIGGKMEFLASFMSFTFSNSNPLLHPARLVELLQKEAYDSCPLFYAEWGDLASELYVAADDEMRSVFEACDLEAARLDYESALEHYGISNSNELTEKIRSIQAFKTIVAPYKKCEDDLWRPDFTSRYYTEDVPYGTCIIQQYARKVGISTPVIDMLISKIRGCICTNVPHDNKLINASYCYV